MDGHFFYELVEQYGLYAVFFLAMIEGDITLLLAGVLAHSAFFGEWSFLKVLCAGTLGGMASDQVAYAMGRSFRNSVRDFRFYRVARPRIERLTETFGTLSIFLSKYVYGLRTATCVFYGVGRMRYPRFLLVASASCFLWVAILSGAGYFFSGAVTNLIGDFQHLGKLLLVIVMIGIAGFYLLEHYWLSPRVEEANPQRVHELEQAAHEKLQEIGQEIQERLPPLARRKDSAKQRRTKRGEIEGD